MSNDNDIMNIDKSDEELIRLAVRHDEAAVDELMNRYKGLVRKQARALYLIGGDNDDLIQEGMIALYKAINHFSPDRSDERGSSLDTDDGTSDKKSLDVDRTEVSSGGFAAYASRCISNHLYNVIKSANRLKNAPLNQSISLDAPINNSAENDDSRTVADTLPPDTYSDPAQILIDRESVSDILDSINEELSPLEQRVVSLYVDGNSISKIAEIMDKPPKSIDNALQRVKKKLSRHVS